ncbi:UNVERIFIED_CONTAM: hypothetical protein NCL1_22061 [Trichonephila clavipes]
MQFGTLSSWVINSICLYCSDIRTVMEFSSKTTIHFTSPGWLLAANIWQVIPVKRRQELIESMPRPVAAVMKAQLVTRLVSLIEWHFSVLSRIDIFTCRK